MNYVTAHLVAIIDPDTLTIIGVDVWGPEAPWEKTHHGDGQIWASLLEGRGADYHEASEYLYTVYPMMFPQLSERFPCERKHVEGEVIAIVRPT